MEAICVAFIAENSLSFSISKILIKLVRVAQRWNCFEKIAHVQDDSVIETDMDLV